MKKHLDVTAIVPDAAPERAEADLTANSSITLTRRGSLWLINLLENPAPRNAAFRAAQAHYLQTCESAPETDKP